MSTCVIVLLLLLLQLLLLRAHHGHGVPQILRCDWLICQVHVPRWKTHYRHSPKVHDNLHELQAPFENKNYYC